MNGAAAQSLSKIRFPIESADASVLTRIYEEEINIAIWNRVLPANVQLVVQRFLEEQTRFQSSITVSPETALTGVLEALGSNRYKALAENIAELVDMFCCLFELKRAGLRMTILDSPMCPKFHVDKVPCRLLTTFQGIATEWLEHEHVNRTGLGTGTARLYENESDIQQLVAGQVALLKGERWDGNENAGLVHRSPIVPNNEKRLLLTLDFSN